MSKYEYVFDRGLIIRWDLVVKVANYSELEEFIQSMTSCSLSFESATDKEVCEFYSYESIKLFKSDKGQIYTIAIEPCLISFFCRTLNLISFNSKKKTYNIAVSKLFFNNQTPLNGYGTIHFRFTCSPAWDSKIDLECYSFSYNGGGKIFPVAPKFLHNGNCNYDLNTKLHDDVMNKMCKYMAAANQDKIDKIVSFMFSDKNNNYAMNNFSKKEFVFDGRRSKFVYKHPFHFNTKCLFVRVKNVYNKNILNEENVGEILGGKNNDEILGGKSNNRITNNFSENRKVKSVYLRYQNADDIEKKKNYNTVLDDYTANLLSATPLLLPLIILIREYGCSIYQNMGNKNGNENNDWRIITRPSGNGENFCPLHTNYYHPVYHRKECKVEEYKTKTYNETKIIRELKSTFDEEKLVIEFQINPLVNSIIEIISMDTVQLKKQCKITGGHCYNYSNREYNFCRFIHRHLVPLYMIDRFTQ